ncbi:MAG: hypothetical protein IMW98_01650 [Firmicutes bacterium]|nr:hypothetical protein [Bacillota bacterium]
MRDGTAQAAVELVRRAPAIPFYLVLMYALPSLATWVAARLLLLAGERDAARLLPIGLLVLAAAPAYASGLMTLFRAAVRGEPVARETFLLGAGTYYGRVIGGAGLQFLVTLFLSAPLVALLAGGPGRLSIETGAPLPVWGFDLWRQVAVRPEFAILALGMLAVQWGALYWAPAVALGDLTATAGLAAAVRAAARRWPGTLVLVILNGAVTSVLTALVTALGGAPSTGLVPASGALWDVASAEALWGVVLSAALQGAWQSFFRAFVWISYAVREERAADGAETGAA